jgi:hypothetical protein
MAAPTVPRFNEAMWVAGYYLSFAVHMISMDQGVFRPVGGSVRDGKTFLRSFDAKRMEVAAAEGRTWLESNPDHLDHAVLLFDGYYNLPNRKVDALCAEIVDYAQPRQNLRVALPYRPVTSAAGLAIYRLKVILENEADMNGETAQTLGQTLMDGFEAYSEGFDIWKQHQDESI